MALQHLRSSTADKRPDPTAMADGQLAINTESNSPGVFFKDSAGNLVKVGPVHVGTAAPNASPAVGGEAGNSVGEQWLDTTGGTYVFKVWDGTAWQSETGTFVDVNGDTMTGALGIIAGTAAAPGLFISADTNTGIYSPGADELAISTGGTERALIDSSGRLGLGTSSPGGLLHLSNGTGNPDIILDKAEAGAGTLKFYKAGSGSAYIQYDSGEDLVYYSPSGAGSQVFYTAGSPRVTINNSGSVGIGTTTPGDTLELSSSLPGLTWTDTTNSGKARVYLDDYIYTVTVDAANAISDSALAIRIDNSERARIDSSGRLGLGTSSPSSLLTLGGNDITGSSQKITYKAGSTDAASIEFVTEEGGVNRDAGIKLNVMQNTSLFTLLYAEGTNGGRVGIGTTSPNEKLTIADSGSANVYIALQNSTTGTTSADGWYIGAAGTELQLYGKENGPISFTTNSTEKARLTADGKLLIGTSAEQFAPANLTVLSGGISGIVSRNNAAGGWNLQCGASSNSGTYYFVAFQRHDTSALIGQITSTNGTTTTYGTTSDYRLKENVQPLTGAISRVKQLQPKRFNFIANTQETLDGFLAHEVDEVTPQAVVGAKDAVEDDGQIKPQCIDHSMMVPLLTAALQEAIAKIETLEQRLSDAGIA